MNFAQFATVLGDVVGHWIEPRLWLDFSDLVAITECELALLYYNKDQ